MDWSPQQAQALAVVGRWLHDPSASQVFYLAGYAGTGKTTLARHLARQDDGHVLFASFTGKAADVMRRRGCEGATTLHSLLYRVSERGTSRLRALEEDLLRTHATGAPTATIEREIKEERRRLRRPCFELNQESPLREASLLVVDEGSTVGADLGADVLSFGVRVLVLGDPAQLPPVYGAGFFTSRRPDVTLTDIRRQAFNSPVVALATAVREGRPLRAGRHGESVVVDRHDFDRESIAPGEQILVGRNETRRRANVWARQRDGRQSWRPEEGDRLVCLRNNHEAGLLNGGTWLVDAATDDELDLVGLNLQDGDRRVHVVAHAQPFRGEEVPIHSRRDAEEFDYGYALTVHKAQGSEWPAVVVIDESSCFGENARRHLYTAITRAQDRATVVL